MAKRRFKGWFYLSRSENLNKKDAPHNGRPITRKKIQFLNQK